jgi:hypothetical protein
MAFGPDHAVVWVVSGSKDENQVEAHSRTQAEAWWRACEQAGAVGMLARPHRGP